MSFHDLENIEKHLKETIGASKEQTNEYVKNVTQFYSQVEKWLEPKIKAGKVTLNRVPEDLKELSGRNYHLDALELQVGKQTIFVNPKGLNAQAVKHHKGVIAMESQGAKKASYKFILTPQGQWEYEAAGAKYEPLNETKFNQLYDTLAK